MRYTPGKGTSPQAEALRTSLGPVAGGLGLSLIEALVLRSGGSVQVRLVVRKKGPGKAVGIDDCSAFHRAALPRLEMAFPEDDFSVEVSSPGIDRLIRDGAEFAHYMGERVRCYRTDISDWSEGILESSDDTGITLREDSRESSPENGGLLRLNYDVIAKAKLHGWEV